MNYERFLLFTLVLYLIGSCSNLSSGDYFNKGCAMNEQGNYRGAIIYYTRAIELDSLYKEAYCQRGISKQWLNDHQAALSDFNKAIDLDSLYAEAYCSRALSKVNGGDIRGRDMRGVIAILSRDQYQKAEADYTKAIEINPEYAIAYMGRGILRILIDQKDSACLDFSKAKQLGYIDAKEELKKWCE